MALDNLKQVGKHMKQTRKDVDFVLGRNLPFRITIERIRDILTADLPAEMVFTTEKDETRVTVDIRFLKPPSPEALHAAFDGFCESFPIGTTPAIFTLNFAFDPGSVRVYMNGDPFDPAKWYEYSANQVYVSGGTHTLTNTVDICYEISA